MFLYKSVQLLFSAIAYAYIAYGIRASEKDVNDLIMQSGCWHALNNELQHSHHHDSTYAEYVLANQAKMNSSNYSNW